MIYRKLTIISFIFMAQLAVANPMWHESDESVQKNAKVKAEANQDLMVRGLKSFKDDVYSDQVAEKTVLTPVQKHQAMVWSLTFDEEKRYLFLMQNRSGLYYGKVTLSPVDILGLNARSDEERQHFAAISAKQESQKIAQNLAWNAAFTKAYRQMTQGTPVIRPFNYAKFSPYHYQPVQLKQGDVLDLFTDISTPISGAFSDLIELLEKHPGVQLNVYFVSGKITDKAIQQWANTQALPANWVKNKRVTLNHGGSEYSALKVANKRVPLLILVRGNHASTLDLGRF